MKYFEVYFPDGTRGVFGSSSNTSTNYLYYPVMSMRDMFGNTITYTYTFSDNHYKINKISYNGASVEFQYVTRSDLLTTYNAGLKLFEPQILNRITCKLGTTILGTYFLSYTTQNAVSLLTQISYTASGKSFNPIRFYYGSGLTATAYTKSQIQLYEWYSYTDPSMVKLVKGKFDYTSGADGLMVLPNLNPYWKHFRDSNVFRHSQNRFDNKYTGEEQIFLYAGLQGTSVTPMPNLKTEKGFVDIFCADLEGKQEEYIVKVNNQVVSNNDKVTFTVYRSSIYGGLAKLYTRNYSFSTVYTDADGGKSIQPKFYYPGDFNGDGKMEVLAVSAHEPFGDTTKPSKCYVFDLANDTILYQAHLFDYIVDFVGTRQTNPTEAVNNTDKLFVMDYDGDGKTDICHINSSGLHLYSFTNATVTNMTASEKATYTGITKSGLANRHVLFGEYNGDTYMDLMVSPSNTSSSDVTWAIHNSKGNGQFAKTTFSGSAHSSADNTGFITHDVNCDGKTDLISYNTSGFYTFVARTNNVGGNKFYTSFPSTLSILVPTSMTSRNSFTQLLSLKDGVVTKYQFPRDDKRESMITGMANSLGVVERNEYQLIDESTGYYTKGSNATFPYVSIQEPLAVLTATETYMNGTQVDHSTYTYYNAVVHLQGLGFCGFERITEYGKGNQPTEYTYEPYRYGLLKSEKSSKYERYYYYAVMRQSNKTVKIRLMHKEDRDLLKGINAAYTYTYDTYGYPTQEIISYSDAINIKKVNTYAQNPTVGNSYHLDFLSSQEVTVTHNGSNYVKRTYIPAHAGRKPIVKLEYVNGNQVKDYHYTYDSYGNPLVEAVKSYTSNNIQNTNYTYDSYGRVTKVTNPLGLSTELTYDAMGRIATKLDYRGGTTSYTYDAFGREVLVVNPDSTEVSTHYSWSSNGTNGLYAVTKSSSTEPSSTIVYDALGREVRRSEMRFDGDYNSVDKLYDIYGNLHKESLPFVGTSASSWKIYGYDGYDRLLSCEEPSGRETSYSYSGNSVTTVDNNLSTTRTYNSQGQLVSIEDATGTTTYDLAPDGQPESVEAPGSVITTFGYDTYRRRTSIVDPSLGTITYEYDTAGNVSTETDANGKAKQYQYDNYNRLIKATTPELVTVYTYNNKNELTSVSSNNGTSKSFSYDSFGRLSMERENAMDYKWLQKDYTYDAGRIGSIKYTSQNGVLTTERYVYANGRLESVKVDGFSENYLLFGVNAYGQPTGVATGCLTRSYSYDAYGLPTGRTAGYGPTTVYDFSYVFNPETMMLTSRKDDQRNIVETFMYDNMNRLTTFGDKSTSYDDKGNITGMSDIGTFSYGLTQKPYAFSSVATSSAYVSANTQSVTYASFCRPLSIAENGYTATFDYNGLYDRVKMNVKQDSVGLLTRYYLGNNYELDETSTSSKEKLYVMGGYYSAPVVLVKENDSTKLYYIMRDYLGSITHIISSNGAIVQELSYDAWGRLRNPANQLVYAVGEAPELFLGRGYTGHEHLTQFGLINMNARLYDPFVGRFLSPDPYVQMPDMPQNFNRYSYTLNNPLIYTDKSGKFFIFTLITAITEAVWNVIDKGINFGDYTWRHTDNAFLIDRGMFRGNLGQIVNKWTWGLVNSYVGKIVSHGYNLADKVDGVTELEGMLALSGATSGNSAFTIGHYSLGPKGYVADWRDHLFVHEYGHYIQSQQWGALYFPAIAIPSFFSAWVTSKWSGMDHSQRWFEVNASKLGAKYFDERYGSGVDGYSEMSADYFNIDVFRDKNIPSAYSNPRTKDGRQDKSFPTSGSRMVVWDIIL